MNLAEYLNQGAGCSIVPGTSIKFEYPELTDEQVAALRTFDEKVDAYVALAVATVHASGREAVLARLRGVQQARLDYLLGLPSLWPSRVIITELFSIPPTISGVE